jgi:ABC-2 type transport system permease protein
MRALMPVMRREYLIRVRSKWFLVGTFLAPLLFIGMMVVPILFESRNAEVRRSLTVLDETGVLLERVGPRLEQAGFTVQEAPSDSEEALRAMVEAEDIGGYLVLGPDALARGAAVYRGREAPSTLRGLSIRSAVAQSALELHLTATGDEEEVRSLLAGGELAVELLETDRPGAAEDEPEFVAAFIGATMLYMVILLYAVTVMRSTLEEKTGRIVEILISSVRPWELMLGKILGVGSVGLTQLGVWVGLGAIAFTMGLPALAASRPEMMDTEFIARAMPDPGLLALFLAFFFGGFFLYAALYAAVGAMCSTEEEAQQAQAPFIMLLVFPMVFMMPVIQDPNSTLAVASSLFPFFTPILMYARAGTGVVPFWQVLLSLVLLFGAVLAVA